MTFSTTKRIVAHIICVSTVLYFTGVALAQVEQETDEDATMEVIYVTAEKREENILDVPLSITAFNDDLIEELGITNDFDVEQLVPGLQFGDDTEKVGQGTVEQFGLQFGDDTEKSRYSHSRYRLSTVGRNT